MASQPNCDEAPRTATSGDDKATGALYQQPRPNVKIVRILTVLGYVFCVSSAAIMLSLYYVFLWDPYGGSAAAGLVPMDANMSACAAQIQAQRLTQAVSSVPMADGLLSPSPTGFLTPQL